MQTQSVIRQFISIRSPTKLSKMKRVEENKSDATPEPKQSSHTKLLAAEPPPFPKHDGVSPPFDIPRRAQLNTERLDFRSIKAFLAGAKNAVREHIGALRDDLGTSVKPSRDTRPKILRILAGGRNKFRRRSFVMSSRMHISAWRSGVGFTLWPLRPAN